MDTHSSSVHWFAALAPALVGVTMITFALMLVTGCEDPRQITSAEGEMGVVVDGKAPSARCHRG